MDPIRLQLLLQRAATSPDPPAELEVVVDQLGQDPDLTTVVTVLRFMENNPSLDYGSPGALVHFVERFSGPAYEIELLASLMRRPTDHTVWMLNRVINGTPSIAEREKLIFAL